MADTTDAGPAHSLVLLCRPGFERECAGELPGLSIAAAEPGSGWVEARPGSGPAIRLPRFRELVFARDRFTGAAFALSDTRDRITPLVALAQALGPAGTLWLQHVDTEEGRSVSRLGLRLQARLEAALRENGVLRAGQPGRLHLLFLDGARGFIGNSVPGDGARWSMGIPRLRLPGAPSRSAAKLEEALLWFGERPELPSPASGMSAVDLGAAPGGWTWVLARRGLQVLAVDHGRLSREALDAGAVRYLAGDAFTFRPRRPVDWLVCDIVDKPARVAELVQRWFTQGWCRASVFNLKLPMRDRLGEVRRILGRFEGLCGGSLLLEARQLYHDREEITVFLARR